MLFKQCRFKDKHKVRKTMKNTILANIKDEIPYDECNTGKILEYIDDLLNETDYDIKGQKFYYRHRHIRISLDTELLSKIVSEYLIEHLEDFILEKNKNTL